MISKPISPCKDCTERRTACHSECEKGLKYEKENAEYRSSIEKEKLKTSIYNSYRKHMDIQISRRKRNKEGH